MAKRIFAASCIAILGTGLMLAPQVWAGGRGPSGGHTHGSAPAALRAPVGKTVAHARAHHAFRDARLHHRRAFTPLWNGWWNAGCYGGYCDPSTTALPSDRLLQAEPAPSYPSFYTGGPYVAPYAAPADPKPAHVIVYRPGCSSETQTIPWSDGKDRPITIVRC